MKVLLEIEHINQLLWNATPLIWTKKSNLWLSDYNSWLYQDCKKELKLSLTLKFVNFAGFEYYCLFIFSSSTSTCIFCTIQNLHLFRIKQRSSKSSTELACLISNVHKWIKAILLQLSLNKGLTKSNVLLKEKLVLRTIFSSLYVKKSSLIPDLQKESCLPLFIMTLYPWIYIVYLGRSVQFCFLLNVAIECLSLEEQCTLPHWPPCFRKFSARVLWSHPRYPSMSPFV